MRQGVSERIGQWLASKSPRAKYFVLSRHNIYIFPTSAGFAFLGLLLLMLLTAINYQSSLIYLFTFFLSAIFFISIWLCFLNLLGLEVSSSVSGSCYAGDASPYNLTFRRESKSPFGLCVGETKQNLFSVEFTNQGSHEFTLMLPPGKRGRYVLPRLRLESRFPFGFIVAWTWLKIDAELIVYPKPVFGARRVSGYTGSNIDFAQQQGDELTDIKSYQPSDPGSRILWKKLAAKDELVVRHFDEVSYDPSWLRWGDYEASNVEDKLSHLCFDVCRLSANNDLFGLDIPGKHIPPDCGENHRNQCLMALALYNLVN